MSAVFLQGDARALPLPNDSVDLVVTSPPYFGLRDYGTPGELGSEPTPSAFVRALVAATAEMARVLRPRGSIFVNLGDSYSAYNANRGDGRMQTNAGQQRPSLPRGLSSGGEARNKSLMLVPERFRIACADDLGLIVRAVIVWRKTPSMPAGRLRDRVRTVHEEWVHLTRVDRYFFHEERLRVLGDGQVPPSVWPGPVARGSIDGAHPAMFAPEWPRRFIAGWCPDDGVVLDPFGGAGTTAIEADVLGRTGVSVDLSHDYTAAAARRWRTTPFTTYEAAS